MIAAALGGGRPAVEVYENFDGSGSYGEYGAFGGISSGGAPAMISGSSPGFADPVDGQLWYSWASPDDSWQGYGYISARPCP